MQIGQVVKILAGRDAGKYAAVVDENDGCVFVCDGKERPLERSKRKNLKHIEPTALVLSTEQLQSNRALKKALKIFNACDVKED